VIIFPHFLLETGSVMCSGNRLPILTESDNWHTATNSFELQREAYSRYLHNRVKPISTISWLVHRIYAADTAYLLFKEFPTKLRNISGSMRNEDLSIYVTFNPCQFLLDSPFKPIKPDFCNLKEGGLQKI
jgi:hypothetical protein